MKIEKNEIHNIYGEAPQSFHNTMVETLDSLDEAAPIRYYRTRRLAAFAAAAALLSVGVLGANAVIKSFAPVKDGNYGLNITVGDSSDSEPGLMTLGAPSNTPEYIKPNVGYLPEGMYFSDQHGKYLSDDETKCMTIVYQRITEQQTIQDFNVASYEELTINGHAAMITYSAIPEAENEYTRHFYIYFEDTATLVEAFVTYGVSDEELMKIMEGITVEECDTDMYGMSFTQAKKEYAEEKRDEQITAFLDKASELTRNDKLIPINIGTKIKYGKGTELYECGGIEYSIDSIEVLDNIGALDYNKFSDWHIDLDNDVDENGNFLPYERNTYSYGDGVNAPFTMVVGQDEIERRLIYATLTVTNTSDSISNFFYQGLGITNYTDDNGILKENDKTEKYLISEPAYIDGNNVDSEGMKAGWNSLTLAPGETRTVYIGFVCDADYIDDLYLTDDGGFPRYRYDNKTSMLNVSSSINPDGTFNHDTLCTKVR